MIEGPVPATYSWVADLMQRVPAYTLMAGLFVYWILVVNPKREAWWWEEMTMQRKAGEAAAVELLRRQDLTIQSLETQCYQMAKENSVLLRENSRILAEMQRAQTLRGQQ